MQIPGPHERDHVLSAPGAIPGHYFQSIGVNQNSPHHVAGMIPHGHPHQFHHPHPLLTLNRIPHFIGQPELRIFEMNKRLQQRIEDCDSLWWEAFTTDFFEDDATLTIGFLTEDGPKRYTIGRTLIPRYFRSIFESGCGELHYNLRLNHEYFHHPNLTLDSEAATMTMNMMRAIPATIVVEGRLTLEFVLDDLMRIRSWIFVIRSHREMIMRSMLGIQDPAFLDQLTKNITRYGMTTNTLNFFRLCLILEPMQELMSRQKAYSLTPRDCLKTTLFQKWQRMMPQEATRQPSKRRKRKGSAAASDGGNNNSTGRASKRKQSPGPLSLHHIAQPGDVMIVGEPTLMGGDFGDEDERLITRLENAQYDASVNPLPPTSLMHMNFSGPNDSSVCAMPSSIGNSNIPLNAGAHSVQSVQFRGSMGSGITNSHPGLCSGDPIYSNNFPPVSMHQSGMPVSMIPGHHPMMQGRFLSHNPPSSQHYVLMPSKSVPSGSAPPGSRDSFPMSLASGLTDPIHQPVRSGSASSLMDGTNMSGFLSCPSPNVLPSRLAARFTPPGLLNGLGTIGPNTGPQTHFLMPADMASCANSASQVGTICSPPASYTPESMETSYVMHPSMHQASQSNAVKSSNSPLMFNCFVSSANGTALPHDSLSSLMTGPGCEPLLPMSLNDNEDMKPVLVHRARSNSESV